MPDVGRDIKWCRLVIAEAKKLGLTGEAAYQHIMKRGGPTREWKPRHGLPPLE